MGRRIVLSVAGFALVLALAYYGTELWLTRQLEERVAALSRQLPPSVSLDVGGSSVRLFGYQARLGDVVVSGPAGRLRIGEIAFDHFDFSNEVPHYASGTARGLALTAAESAPEGRALLTELGYDRVALDIAFAYRYDPDKSLLTLDNLRVEGPGVGRLELTAEVANVATLAPETPLATLALMLRAALGKATLRYHDDGLAARLKAREARRAGVAVADYQARVAQGFDEAIAKTADDGPREAMAKLKSFIEQPGGVTVTAAPREPVPIFRLATARNPAVALRLLGVTVINAP
jgi:hypothetical protein